MKIHIKRQKGPNEQAYWQTFEYNGSKNVTVVTVLNTLNYNDDLYDIEGNPASRIRWECSCIQGVCGACAMVINDKPSLACDIFLKNLKGKELFIEPLSKFPVIADLMVDRSIIHDNLKEVQSFLNDKSDAVSNENNHRYSVAKCLKCGLCLEVCPNYTYGSNFFGPSFANDMYLLHSSQTEGDKKILMAYKEHFVSNCSKALSCLNVCPAKIDTLTSIINMNRVKE